MVLTGNGLYQLPCAVYWWGCCLSSSPVVGKQWHFASSALQVRGKSNQCTILWAPRCEHQLPSCYSLWESSHHQWSTSAAAMLPGFSPLLPNSSSCSPSFSPAPSLKRDLCFSLETSSTLPCRLHLSFAATPLSGFSFSCSWTQICRQNCAFLQREIWESLGRELGKQGAEERTLTCRSGTLAKASVFQLSMSKFRTVPAKPARLLCCHH